MNITSLKTKINNKAKMNNQSPQELMQMYFFERILYRISVSKYKYNFIIKGGLLLSSMFEDASRTTQDMDTMIKGISIDELKLREVIEYILSIETDDNINFEILNFKHIREEDLYGGYRVSIKANIETLTVQLKIDITTGDPIFPKEIEYSYKSLIEDKAIKIMAFSKYTIIAEKFETLETDTRAKDFYDIYKLVDNNIDTDKLFNAIYNTFKRRNTLELLNQLKNRYEVIKKSIALQKYWETYQKKHHYAKEIQYSDFIKSISKIINIIDKQKITQ